jgi:insulysin
MGVSFVENHRSITLAVFKYLSLLRASQFEAFHQRELAALSSTRFRFSEKKRPEDYASWVTEQMAWPVPKELLLAAPQIMWDWDSHDKKGFDGEKKVREYLEGFRVDNGRVLLMANEEEHAKIASGAKWEKEPWYGTLYRVEKLDEEFVKQVNCAELCDCCLFTEGWMIQAQEPNDIPELFLPGPNEFIPTNLNVEKREVDQVS